jgi:UDP-N-acetylglucosamine--N-acetylmuramyl-(pentapeptide) pyrophosphoryl-undecaprenol N-acetylglucosamine transferase
LANERNILICAGGTGGHLFPAQALARELSAKGWTIHLATDARARRFTADFPAEAIHIIKAATISGRNPLKMLKALFVLGGGYRQSRALIEALKPEAVIGFGGYPTLPPIMAASTARVPILLHEQNAVMGRANRLLAKKAIAIVMGFAAGNASENQKVKVLGNPVRAEVLAAAEKDYVKRKKGSKFNLLVFGGSQGAQYFSKVLPQALALMDKAPRDNISLVQQAREEDEAELVEELVKLNIEHNVAQFFSPMATQIAKADFVISRAGASTVSELAVIGRPSLLVPYPFALDHDQAMNAAELEKSGGCKVVTQSQLTPQRLAEELQFAIDNPAELEKQAKAAKKTGKPFAAGEFAILVENIIETTTRV